MSELPPILPYAQAPDQPRPGILSAVGWISIVLGSLSILANACGVLQPFSYFLLRSLPPTTGPASAQFAGFSRISLVPIFLASGLSLLELALGIYLLIAGILLVRNHASSRRHHLRYAFMKIPAATIAALVQGWLQYHVQSAMLAGMPPASAGAGGPPATFSAFPAIVAIMSVGFVLILSLCYPIALIIIMTRPKLGEWFMTIPD